MPTTERPVSKTRVRNIATDIRREADRVASLVNIVDNQRQDGESLRDALHRHPAAMTRIHDSLGDIDGLSAILRELLEVGD